MTKFGVSRARGFRMDYDRGALQFLSCSMIPLPSRCLLHRALGGLGIYFSCAKYSKYTRPLYKNPYVNL